MNEATIESIEWHRDQLFKLLDDGDLYKMDGEISSVKSDLNEIIEKAKSKKKVRVKATASRKAHYREQTVGSDEESLERLKRTASTLLGQEKELRAAGKKDEADKFRAEKVRPILDKMNAADEKSAKILDRTEDKRVQGDKDDRSLEGIKTQASSLISEEIKLKAKGDTAGAKKLRKETIKPLLARMDALEAKTGGWDD